MGVELCVRKKSDVEIVVQASPAQQGILAYALRAGDKDPYLYQYGFEIEGLFDQDAFKKSWETVAAHYQVLRTDYRWKEVDIPLQVVFKTPLIDIDIQSVSEFSNKDTELKIARTLNAVRVGGFDFTQSSKVNIKVFVANKNHWRFYWSFHHVALDGWSVSKILGDLLQCYKAFIRRQVFQPSTTLPYASYVQWIYRQDEKIADRYWSELLADFQCVTPLPLMGEYPDRCYADYQFSLSQENTQHIQKFASKKNITVNTLLQAAWGWLLARYSNSDDVIFGVTTSGRSSTLSGVESTVGLCINTLPLRVKLDPQVPVEIWLQEIQQQNLNIRNYEYSALSALTKYTDLSAGEDLFESILVFENYPIDEALKEAPRGWRIKSLGQLKKSEEGEIVYHYGRNNYPISVIASLGDHLKLVLSYHCQYFSADAIAEIAIQLEKAIFMLAKVNKEKIGNLIPLLHTDRDVECVGEINETISQTVIERFAAIQRLLQDQGREDEDAVICAIGTKSWRELDLESSRLANYLCEQGIGREIAVAVLMDRCCDWLVAVLAILKAGGVYVPMDTQWPVSRIRHILKDVSANLLLYNNASLVTMDHKEFFEFPCQSLNITEMDYSQYSDTSPPVKPLLQQTAYIIYTSGSTGQPKGVLISHHSLANYVQGLQERLQLPSEVSMAIVSTIAADLGHTALFSALAYGRLLHLLPHNYAFDPDAFANYMTTHQVGVLKIVPSHLQGLLQAIQPEKVLPQHALIVGGEMCSWKLVEKIHKLNPGCRVINHYGPTETTVGVSTYEVDTEKKGFRSVPIGRSLPNSVLHIFDNYLNPVPDSVAGELYIGGAGVAHGYIGNAALTAERFVPDPYTAGDERCYRAGDWVRLVNGQLEFLGRVDDQVKIRGYRVELNEVANALKRLSEVQDAIVQAVPLENNDSHLQLIAYCILNRLIATEEIQQLLQESLPEHMVPTTIIILDKFPLTYNGKLDRKALPKPGRASQQAYESPKGEVEQILAEIWAEVLSVEKVGRNDNFFALGGDSILSLKVVARARKQGIHLHPQKIFENPVLSAIAKIINYDTKPREEFQKRRDFVKRESPITLMNKNGNKPSAMPLYCIVPWRGDIEVAYGVLARQIEMRRNVYGVACVNVDRFKSIEDLAIYYSEQIKSYQKDGPYSFVGWSLSCITIMHMASILEKQGYEIRFLGLIDSFLPGKPNRFFYAKQKLGENIAQHFVDDEEIINKILDLSDQYFKGLSEVDLRLRILGMNELKSAGISDGDLDLAINKLVEYLEKEKIHDAIHELPSLKVIPHAYWAESTSSEYIASFCKLLQKFPISYTINNTDHLTIIKNYSLAREIDRTINSFNNF